MKHSVSALALVLASLATSPQLVAQENGQPLPESAASRTPDADEAVRLLFLADGSVLRTRTRHGAAGWEVQENKNIWKTLPEGLVSRALLERDVLAEAKRLEQQIAAGQRPEENARRVGLADWMLSQGLTTEALGQLDRVLASDPDQAQALHVLTRLATQLNIGAVENALASDEPTLGVLRAVANATPSVREIAVQRLGAGGSSDELRAELRSQLVSHSPRLRSAAAFALRRIFPGNKLRVDDVKELINRSVLDGSDEVRAEAARALRDVRDPSVTGPALHALGSSNPRLRENSIHALASMGYPTTVEPLITYLSRVDAAIQSGKPSGIAGGYIFVGKQTAYIQDFDVEVANGSAIADPQVNVQTEGAVLDGRVLGAYTVSFVTEARMVRSALADLTGVDAGSTNRAWFSWWEANKDKWGKSAPAPEGTSPATPPTKAN